MAIDAQIHLLTLALEEAEAFLRLNNDDEALQLLVEAEKQIHGELSAQLTLLFDKNSPQLDFWTTHENSLFAIYAFYNKIVEIHSRSGAFNEAEKVLRGMLVLSTLVADINQQALCRRQLGTIHLRKSNNSEAYKHLFEAITLDKQRSNRLDLCDDYILLGIFFKNTGDYTKSADFFTQALTIAEAYGDKKRTGSALGNLANIYLRLENNLQAYEYLNRSLSLHQEIGDIAALANDYNNLANVYSKINEKQKSIEYYKKALEIELKLGRKDGIATAWGNIGRTYADLSEFEQALTYLTKSVALNEELERFASQANDLRSLSGIYSHPKSPYYLPEKAEELLLESLNILETLNVAHYTIAAHHSLVEFYKSLKNSDKALYHLERAGRLEQKTASHETRKSVDRYHYEYQNSLIEQERRITDELLRRFFPVALVPILKDALKTKSFDLSDTYDSVSILFADIVGFTQITPTISPDNLVELVNFILSYSDATLQKYHCERLRAIGDGFLAVCGVPERRPNHIELLTSAAIELQRSLVLPEKIQSYLPPDKKIQLRIGIHTGRVLAGIVGGLEKLQYDIYGETVNIASRMESYGLPGKVHCSEAIYLALKNNPLFTFEAREPLAMKGIGTMTTYIIGAK